MNGSPSVILKAPLANMTVNEYALTLIRWQPLPWQAMVNTGKAAAPTRIAPML